VAGCTTAGEHLSGEHHRGALVLAGIVSPKVRWTTTVVEDIAAFDQSEADAASQRLFADLGVDQSWFDPRELFCLTFIDGLSMKEEMVVSMVAEALAGVRLVGGSAGDDLQFRETAVITSGRALTNAAVLVLAHSKTPFEIIKHQHFVETSRTVAITRADVAARRVYEMDGIPAAQAYARALGIDRSQLTDDLTFSNPLTFSCRGELYVRSIQKVHDDDSISFYCGIEEGMVLDLGGRTSMVGALRDDLSKVAGESKKFDFLIGCNCILRALEAEAGSSHPAIGDALTSVCKASIGFDTYGEQLDGLHINQTLVALAFRDAPEEEAA
jgi:hypothetical protein